jgi:Predicted SAM-dependent methyltransferase
MHVHGLLGYCRQGFEPELAAELGERAAAAGIAGYARATRDDGYVLFVTGEEADAQVLARALPFRDLVFARQKLRLLAELRDLDPKDRLAPLLAALPAGLRLGDVWVEHPDSDAGKPLSGLARAFGNALRPALRKAGLLSPKEDARLPRLHVCFLAGNHALLALADPQDSSPWPLGIPRLKLHPDAPSRSALKLEEASWSCSTPANASACCARA